MATHMEWLKDLDQLLRGTKTSPEALAEGTEHLDLGRHLVICLALGATYGVFMGLYALFAPESPRPLQTLCTMVKVPALFLLTLVVTLPSLYVFSALLNARLTFRSRVSAVAFRIFVALYCLSIGLNVAVFQGLRQWLGVLDPIAVLAASMASALFNFTMIRRFVYTDQTG